jgi:hypothetical protein
MAYSSCGSAETATVETEYWPDMVACNVLGDWESIIPVCGVAHTKVILRARERKYDSASGTHAAFSGEPITHILRRS